MFLAEKDQRETIAQQAHRSDNMTFVVLPSVKDVWPFAVVEAGGDDDRVALVGGLITWTGEPGRRTG
jgi:hypothetical protein